MWRESHPIPPVKANEHTELGRRTSKHGQWDQLNARWFTALWLLISQNIKDVWFQTSRVVTHPIRSPCLSGRTCGAGLMCANISPPASLVVLHGFDVPRRGCFLAELFLSRQEAGWAESTQEALLIACREKLPNPTVIRVTGANTVSRRRTAAPHVSCMYTANTGHCVFQCD